VTAEKLCRLDPGKVSRDGIAAACLVGVTEIANPVAHDQQILDALIGCPLFDFRQVLCVLRLDAELFVLHISEVIRPLHRIQPETFASDAWEVQVVNFSGSQRSVKRPLCERNLKSRFRFRRRRFISLNVATIHGHKSSGDDRSRCPEKVTSVRGDVHVG